MENTNFIVEEIFNEMPVPYYDMDAPSQIPPNLIVDSARRYELIQHLNLDVPTDGLLVPGHVYRLPDDVAVYEDLVPSQDGVETGSLSDRQRPRVPKFLRRLNPFRKKN